MADTGLDKELDALRADMTKLRGDLAGLAEAVKEAGGRKVEGARDSLSDLVEGLREELKSALDLARDRSKRSVESVEHTIEEKPFLSLLTAFGVGVLLGKLLDRR
ncbi:MAG: DUF883 family protein [Deltaproteobacteria bacterium]|nr:DUF883 family protein [Deltaproteobacteria bacterium]